MTYIDKLKKLNDTFTEELFGENEYKPMIGKDGCYEKNPMPEPPLYPKKNVHPRYLITPDRVDKMKTMLNDPTYANLARAFWEYANAGESEHYFGVFPPVEGKEYRYSEKILAIIDAKALAYLITRDKTYALEALVCVKNAIINLHFTREIHGDVYHGPSHLMVTLAAVYDWCYDAMTESDKWQLIYAVATRLAPGLEDGMKYPPSGMCGVCGHGTGPQFLRDWMTVATVFYDEVPDWWSFIVGRYFKEYLPVAKRAYKSGWVSQGTAVYGCLKIAAQAWAAYLIKTATGENVFVEDGYRTMHYMLSHMMPNGRYFQTGDGHRSPEGTEVTFTEYFIVAALFNDPVIYAMGREFSFDHTKFYYTQDPGYNSILTMTPAFQVAFAAMVDYKGESPRDGISPIQYFEYPAGQMSAREKWDDPDSAAVIMRIGNLTMSNHDIYDHGTFQIYYKGLLAGTSGRYAGYAMPAHYYYHQATVAHNGLLMFNPSYSDSEPIYNEKPRYPWDYFPNASRYYYSGGQWLRNQPITMEIWQGQEYEMAKTLGAAYGYKADGSPEYAYIAGDITNGYHRDTAEYIERRMLTVFTEDKNFPALFFTYDELESVKPSYEKTWLLHTVKEPEINSDDKTATVVNGGGKLHVCSAFGNTVLEKIGGKDKAYWINGYTDENGVYHEGKNCYDIYTTRDFYETIWGRIQMRVSGEKRTELLTAMAITDADNNTDFTYDKAKNDNIYMIRSGRTSVAFIKSYKRSENEILLPKLGDSECDYYVSGISEGAWSITLDCKELLCVYVKEDEDFTKFTAPAAELKIAKKN